MDGGDLARMGLTLALLLGVPGALLWLMRRLGWRLPGQPTGGQRLQIVARTAIDPKHTLLLIRRDAQEQLLLLAPTGPMVLESAISPSIQDRAHRRQQELEAEQRAAAIEAAMAQARERSRQGVVRFASVIRKASGRVRDRAQPDFAAVLEQSAAATETPKAPARRARRSVKRAKAA